MTIFDDVRDLLYKLGLVALAVYFLRVEYKLSILESQASYARRDIDELFDTNSAHGWKRGVYYGGGWYAASYKGGCDD